MEDIINKSYIIDNGRQLPIIYESNVAVMHILENKVKITTYIPKDNCSNLCVCNTNKCSRNLMNSLIFLMLRCIK